MASLTMERKPVPVINVVEKAESSPRMFKRLKEILTAFCILTIPMVVLSSVLLGIIYRY
jgi:hypothetical protein